MWGSGLDGFWEQDTRSLGSQETYWAPFSGVLSFDVMVNYTQAWASLVAQPVKNLLQCRRPGFNPWVGKIPWRRKWQPTLVLLPGEFHGQRSLAGYSSWDPKESDMTERVTFTFIHKPVPGTSPRQDGPSAQCPQRRRGSVYCLFLMFPTYQTCCSSLMNTSDAAPAVLLTEIHIVTHGSPKA